MPKYGLLPPFLCIFALIYSKPYQYPALECKNRDYGTHYKIVLKRKPSQETRDGSPSPNQGKGQFSKRKRQEGDKGDRGRQGTVLRPLSPNRGRKRQRTVPCLLNVEIFFRRLAKHSAAENDKAADQNEHQSYAEDRRRRHGIGSVRDRNDLKQAH